MGCYSPRPGVASCETRVRREVLLAVPANIEAIRIVSHDEYDVIRRQLDRHLGEFDPWFPLVLDTYRATGCRPAEIVGKNARVDPGVVEGKARQYGTQEHHGVRGMDVLGGSMLFVEGKNTMGGRAKADGLKPRTVICADRDAYGELQELAREALPGAHLWGLGPNPARPYLDGYWRLVKNVRRLRKHLSGNLAGFEPRWLRHSWAVNALRNGVDLVSVQRQLGHSKLEVTAIYLRFAPMDKDKVMAAFDPAPVVPVSTVEKRDCPACGFGWNHDRATGRPVLDSRIGVSLRRRG